MTIAELVARWRFDAARFRAWGQVYLALTVEHCAEELEQAVEQHELELLTITDAAHESGYSESQLRRRFPGQHRIPRSALPKKGSRELGPKLATERRRA
jgi:hypothetical protein